MAAAESPVLVHATRYVAPGGSIEGPAYVLIDKGVIVSISTDRPSTAPAAELAANLLLPGFVDIHTHGLGGHEDVLYSWSNPGFSQQRLARLGTTACLTSLVFRSDPEGSDLARLLQPVLARCGQTGHGTVIEGVHAEGPVIQDLGALAKGDDAMSEAEFAAFIARMGKHLKVMTISPTRDAATGFARIRQLAAAGCLVSLGHDRACTACDIAGAMRAVQAESGSRCHITHLFNVSSFHHRNPSLVNFGLVDQLPAVSEYEGLRPPTVEVICDLAHVDVLALQAVLSARRPEDIVCITDNVLESRPGTKAEYCGRKLEVSADGKAVVLEGTTTLAGSCMSQLDALRALVRVLRLSVGQASMMCSENPCRIAGLDHIGRIAVGMRADLLLMSDGLDLQQTLIAGVPVDMTPEPP